LEGARKRARVRLGHSELVGEDRDLEMIEQPYPREQLPHHASGGETGVADQSGVDARRSQPREESASLRSVCAAPQSGAPNAGGSVDEGLAQHADLLLGARLTERLGLTEVGLGLLEALRSEEHTSE